jgi:hypothetical protein
MLLVCVTNSRLGLFSLVFSVVYSTIRLSIIACGLLETGTISLESSSKTFPSLAEKGLSISGWCNC